MISIIERNIDLANEICLYSKLCYDRNLVGAAGGNLSVRTAQKDSFLITASGVSLRGVTVGNLVAVDINGNILEAPRGLRPSKETGFHLAVFSAKPEINAVVHVHPAYATAFATARKPIPLTTVSAKLKLKQAGIADEADPGSRQLCDNISCRLQEAQIDTSVILLESHGLVAFGNSLCDAFDNAELAEDTAKITYLTDHLRHSGRSNGDNPVIIDLSAPLDSNTACYPTDPSFRMQWHTTFKQSHVNVSKLEMGSHSGTHVDAPLHFLDNAADVTALALDRFTGPAIVIACPKTTGENIMPDDIAVADVRQGDIVLLSTGWEDRSGTPRFFEGDWPALSVEAAEMLAAAKVRAVGGDFASADNPDGIAKGALAHRKLMAAGIPVFEGLINLRQLIGKRFRFIGFPLRLAGVEASPIRAVALL